MLRVLLLDDDENMKILLGYYLKKYGFQADIDQFFNLEDAETCNNEYDMWIVDHRLKNHTGLDFIQHMHIHKPFIYGSFYLNDQLKEAVKKYGGVPLDKNNLLENPESIKNALNDLKIAA